MASSSSADYVPQTILVTGAAGFIASHVINRLLRHHPSYKIVALDKLDYCSNPNNLQPSTLSSPNFTFVVGDVSSSDLLNHLLLTHSVDTVMHFAAHTHVDTSFVGNSLSFTTNNVCATHVLLESCRARGPHIRRFLHVSTDEVYGETDSGDPEASQLLPTNPYSATKAGAEMLVMAYQRSYGLPVITTRGNNVYGPNQYPEKVVPKFILLAMRGQRLPIQGDGSHVRSYLYCDDAAEAFDVVLHRGVVGNVYNIGARRERRVVDVAEDVCGMFGLVAEEVIEYVENRPFNDRRYFLEDQKMKGLGWEERTPWEEGLRRTKEWYMKNPDWWGDVSDALGQCKRKWGGGVIRFLIYGGDGWIGGVLGRLCEERRIEYEYGEGRLEDRRAVLEDLRRVRPTHVFNAVGVGERWNVEWCESRRVEAIRADVVGMLNLVDVCKEKGVAVVNFAMTAIEFEEEDASDFVRSFYSKTKAMVEELLKNYDNVCNLRVGTPISSDLNNPYNVIAKIITRKDKVVKSMRSRMTVLDEMLPMSIEMARRNMTGTWNFTNPGSVSHNEILQMWTDFGLEEQEKVMDDTVELEREFPSLLPIKESLLKYVFEPNRKD
ncbi:putative rhamnose biosynthetic enzyme 1 [Acorus calamus]|uniref:Rhamnose biosynthetic enzyme 1 n=1 Tax=Acorus calamus TaxID=4465 RepID=A0AAV9FCV5_ACOCL|nr:putative rhamnose biosynthetic enzyme 1 [Acorus calamus]